MDESQKHYVKETRKQVLYTVGVHLYDIPEKTKL